jgi:hypothetical protein
MFFADHYRRTWFDTFEPKWYMGFSVASYPPLAHQVLALLSYVTGLEQGYVIITFAFMTLLPIATYFFSKVFISKKASGYAALVSVLVPGILYAVYVYGQFTTLIGIILSLFTVPLFNRYIQTGKLINLAQSVSLFEATIAAHLLTGIICTPLLLLATFLSIVAKREAGFRTILKRFLLFSFIGFICSLAILYPVLFGAVSQNVNIPHPTTKNYFLNLDLFGPFFLNVYGFFLLMIPLTYLVVRRRKNIQPLFIIAVFFMILGLGGTTPLPNIIFGENWLGLTYDRFSIFSVLAFMPLLGSLCTEIEKRRRGKAFLTVFLIICILFASRAVNDSIMRPREKEVPVESLVNFLNHDEHWKYRYLTLGFGPFDFCRLSILTNATTIDGWYYHGRNITSLASIGGGYLSGAKFEENGILALTTVLENASQYNLKFVFCNDRFYEPLLNSTGFNLVDEWYEQVTLWEKPGIAELEISEIVRNNHTPTLQDYIWGIIPLSWLVISLLLISSEVGRKWKTILSFVHYFLLNDPLSKEDLSDS